MSRLLFLLLIAMLCAPLAAAQSTTDYPKWEFFVGYTHERIDSGADRLDTNRDLFGNATVDFDPVRLGFNGFTTEVVGNVHRNIGIVANVSGSYHRATFTDILTNRPFNTRLSQYDILFGPRYNFRNKSSVTPFAHALFGIAHFRATSNDFFSGDADSETDFAMAIGGGLDVRASRKIDVRAIQFDYLPTFFGTQRQDNLRFSTGVKFK